MKYRTSIQLCLNFVLILSLNIDLDIQIKLKNCMNLHAIRVWLTFMGCPNND